MPSSGTRSESHDVLADILDLLRLGSCLYFRSGFAPPWGMAMGRTDFAQFHLVARGHCFLDVSGADDRPIMLSAGDIVVLPHGTAHTLRSDFDAPVVPGTEVLRGQQNGCPLFSDGEASAVMVCGHFELDRRFDHPLIAALPSLIHVRASDLPDVSAAESIATLIAAEMRLRLPGDRVVARRLAEALFVMILRTFFARERPARGFLAALHDPKIGRSLAIMHHDETGSLGLDDIASTVGMSRSALSDRFREIVGFSPMSYATGWRLTKARHLIETTTAPVGSIARSFGYDSEPSFYRAFKKHFDITPGELRRIADRDDGAGLDRDSER